MFSNFISTKQYKIKSKLELKIHAQIKIPLPFSKLDLFSRIISTTTRDEEQNSSKRR